MRGLARKAYQDQIRDSEEPLYSQSNNRNRHFGRDNRHRNRQKQYQNNDKYQPRGSQAFLNLINNQRYQPDEIAENYRHNYTQDRPKQVSINPPDRKSKVAYYKKQGRVVTFQQMDQQLQQYLRKKPSSFLKNKNMIQNKPNTDFPINQDNQDEENAQEMQDLSYSDFKNPKKITEQVQKRQNLSFSINEDDDWGQISQDKEETQIVKQIIIVPHIKKQKQQDSSRVLSIQQDQSFSNNDQSFVSSVHSDPRHDVPNENFSSHMDESSSIADANKVEQALKVIEQSSQFEQKDVMLNLQVQNTLSLTIKQIFLKKLNINIKLITNIDGRIIVKNCEIQIEKLISYISFFKIDIQYPKIYEPNKIDDKLFKFCRIKVPPINKSENKNESKFIKKPKKVMQSIQETLVSLLKISKVELKCMNCDKANEVAVIENTQGFNEAGLSCVGCAEKIFAKMRFSLEP